MLSDLHKLNIFCNNCWFGIILETMEAHAVFLRKRLRESRHRW